MFFSLAALIGTIVTGGIVPLVAVTAIAADVVLASVVGM